MNRQLIKSTYIEIGGIKTPNFNHPYKVVSSPSGNCPYFLLYVDEEFAPEEDIITNSSQFLSQYDLSEPTEEII